MKFVATIFSLGSCLLVHQQQDNGVTAFSSSSFTKRTSSLLQFRPTGVTVSSRSRSHSQLSMNTESNADVKQIRVGVIGMGRIGIVHLEAITKAPGVIPVHVSNPTIAKAEAGTYCIILVSYVITICVTCYVLRVTCYVSKRRETQKYSNRKTKPKSFLILLFFWNSCFIITIHYFSIQ